MSSKSAKGSATPIAVAPQFVAGELVVIRFEHVVRNAAMTLLAWISRGMPRKGAAWI